MDARRPWVSEVRVADDAAVWAALGFRVAGDVARIGPIDIRLVGSGAGRGIVGWTLGDCDTAELDGLATTVTDAEPGGADHRDVHPNGAIGVDHIVVATPDRARTSTVLDAAGLGLRRIRTGAGTPERPMEQAFHRAGAVIVEVVGSPEPDGDGPATFWGLVCTVTDLDVTAAVLDERLGTIRSAVQPGQRIATVRRSAGSSVPLAFIAHDG
jgi:hypothetical protein